jgi:hypothetical protein
MGEEGGWQRGGWRHVRVWRKGWRGENGPRIIDCAASLLCGFVLVESSPGAVILTVRHNTLRKSVK